MPIPAMLAGTAVGLTRLSAALVALTDGIASASQSIQALDAAAPAPAVSRAAPFATAQSLTGPGSQNAIEAEIMRRLFSRSLAGVGVENMTEAEIQRRQVTRVGAERSLVGQLSAADIEIFRRCVTVTVRRA